jgi:hypothetical protein
MNIVITAVTNYHTFTYLKHRNLARHQWLTPIILATKEAEIRKITIPSQPRQIVHETLS